MTADEKFNLIYEAGRSICSAYTGFSKSEVLYCQNKLNWGMIQGFLMSEDPYEALVHFTLHPLPDVVSYYQLFAGCMVQFPDEAENLRLSNLLVIIDTMNDMDEALTNSRMMRALLAINARYDPKDPNCFFKIFYNCKRILAHILRKYPDYMKLSILKSKSKYKKMRFTQQDIEEFQ